MGGTYRTLEFCSLVAFLAPQVLLKILFLPFVLRSNNNELSGYREKVKLFMSICVLLHFGDKKIRHLLQFRSPFFLFCLHPGKVRLLSLDSYYAHLYSCVQLHVNENSRQKKEFQK